MWRALRIRSHSHAGCTRLTSAGGKNSTYVHPSTSLPQHTSCASLVFTEKNHVGYFLNRPLLNQVWVWSETHAPRFNSYESQNFYFLQL
jgi:hypothetical protein